MNYTLIRSKRKTCAICIQNGAVLVRAPLCMPKSEIDRFIDAKAGWIKAKIAEASVREKAQAAFSLSYGDRVPYCGKEYPIVARQGIRAGFSGDCLFMPPDLSVGQIKSACVMIYRMCGKAVLTKKALAFAKLMGVTPAAVKINGAKTRWGSCSGKKNLNFSWRLMMADDRVIDYVVVHELAHIKEMNHSAAFWAVVAQTLPNYKECKKALGDLQKRLAAQDWS